jgi:hypothetical protein
MAGNLFGTTRTVQPGASGSPELRREYTSGGVDFSLPVQNGQNPPFFCTGGSEKSPGRFARSVLIMTHLELVGSFLSSGTMPPVDYFFL